MLSSGTGGFAQVSQSMDGLQQVLIYIGGVLAVMMCFTLIMRRQAAQGVTVLALFGGGVAAWSFIRASNSSKSSTKHGATHTPSAHASSSSHPSTSHGTGSADVPWAWIVFAAVLLIMVAIVVVLIMIVRHRIALARAAAQEREKLAKRWAAAVSDLDAGVDQWLSYDKDLSLLLKAPAMRDYQCAATVKCVNAMGAAENLRTMQPDKNTPAEDASRAVKEFEGAVAEFAHSLTAAVRYATGAGIRSMGRQERRTLEQAQDALRLAQDGATEGERRNAYRLVKRLMTELDLDMPTPAREAIEAAVRQQITAPKVELVKDGGR